MPAQAAHAPRRSLAPLFKPGSELDRRGQPRAKAMRDGQAFRPDGLAASVLIVDLSDAGARLRVRGGQVLPDDFILADPLTFQAHRAAVAWRKDAEVGVRLGRSQSLRGVVPGALQPAKAFCEHALR